MISGGDTQDTGSNDCEEGLLPLPLDARIQSIQRDVYQMRREIHLLKLAVGLLCAVTIVLVLKDNIPPAKSRVSATDIADPEIMPPFYLLIGMSFVGSTAELLLLGPPSMQKKEKSCGMQFALNMFQLYLILSFMYNLYADVSKAVDFAGRSWKSGESTIVTVWMTAQVLLLSMAAGGNMDDVVKYVALYHTCNQQLRFVKAHSDKYFTAVKDLDTETNTGAHACLVESNGPLFKVWYHLCQLYVVPFTLSYATIVLPVALAYCWVVVPSLLLLFCMCRLVITVLLCLNVWHDPTPRAVKIYGEHFKPLDETTCAPDRMEFVLHKTLGILRAATWNNYRLELETLFRTNVCYTAWQVFLFVAVCGQVATSFLATVAVRLLNGADYLPALVETANERHWYLYLSALAHNVTGLAWPEFVWRVF